MFTFLSKFLPDFVYPVGLACILLIVGLVLWKRRSVAKKIVIASLVVLWLGGNRWVALTLMRSLEWQYLPPEQIPQADVIVTLGGGTQPLDYPRQIVEVESAGDRVLYAAWLYKQGAAERILLSGGYLHWHEYITTPAGEMAQILVALGVPEDAILLEADSRNTYENAVYAREILGELGVNKIILVTSAWHMPRSVAVFEKQGFEVIPAPTDYTVTQTVWHELISPDLTTILLDFMPSADSLSKTTMILKEYIGMFIYKLRGWT